MCVRARVFVRVSVCVCVFVCACMCVCIYHAWITDTEKDASPNVVFSCVKYCGVTSTRECVMGHEIILAMINYHLLTYCEVL